MKYILLISGFMLGFTISTILWLSMMSKTEDSKLMDRSKELCSSLGFNSFNIDEHGNVLCKNIIKND